MGKLRKAIAYRRLERPYTRKSRYNEYSFVRGAPRCIITRFDMGNPQGDFDVAVCLISEQDFQLRQNAVESARKAVIRRLEKGIPKNEFHYRIRPYPHHVLRENPLGLTAGADRTSSGMKHAFGKPIGLAARISKGDIIFEVRTKKQYIDAVKKAFEVGKTKLPLSYSIKIIPLKN
ncbi:MAG: 50S ribosomal protein L16 [Candidatus Woesearchaeota archaeon]